MVRRGGKGSLRAHSESRLTLKKQPFRDSGEVYEWG